MGTKAAVIVLHESGDYSSLFFFCFWSIFPRLMNDVSIEPLSQNRTKPLSWDPSDQHVLSIWTLPAPHGLSFQISLNCRIRPSYVFITNHTVYVLGLVVIVMVCCVLFSTVYLLSAWSQMIIRSICNQCCTNPISVIHLPSA